jgi:polyferredoxin
MTMAAERLSAADLLLARTGDWMLRHQRAIRIVQWLVVVCYVVLLIGPALLPLPIRTEHIWTNLTLFAQFVFWGIWWPFVLLSMIFVGRLWCGVLCPEGKLTEAVSAHGKGWAVPRWLSWGGWPFVAFACTTIYGQMVSVYQYPKPVLVILGGSTAAAIAVGYFYGRNKRVWCRYLCPVSGVFALLSKLAPVHFRVDRGAWQTWHKQPRQQVRLNCAPLVPIRTMRGASACHMCGRCSGFRDAIVLARRSPNEEIVHIAGSEPKPVETLLIAFGLLGIAPGAFLWTSSDLFISVKQTIAEWLVQHGITWPLEPLAPWWILTNYPSQNDTLNLLDGAVLIAYIVGLGVVLGLAISLALAASTRVLGAWSTARFHHLAQALIPLAGCGVFLGLSSLTVTMLRAEGFTLDFVGVLRAAMLCGAALWCLVLAWEIAGQYTRSAVLRCASLGIFVAAVAVSTASWASLFWSI